MQVNLNAKKTNRDQISHIQRYYRYPPGSFSQKGSVCLCFFTSEGVRAKLGSDPLLDSPVQGGAVLGSSTWHSSPQVDPVLSACDGGASRAPVDVRGVQRVDNVDARGGQTTRPGRSNTGDGFQSINSFPEVFHFLTWDKRGDHLQWDLQYEGQ